VSDTKRGRVACRIHMNSSLETHWCGSDVTDKYVCHDIYMRSSSNISSRVTVCRLYIAYHELNMIYHEWYIHMYIYVHV